MGRHTETFVALGDSLTEGRGDPDRDGHLIGWAQRLAAGLWPPDGGRLVNLARRNAEVGDVAARQLPLVSAHRPTLLSAIVGVNDVCGSFRPRSFGRAFDGLLKAACAECDTVITATLPDITQLASLPEDVAAALRVRLATANDAIRQAVGRRQVACLELWELSRSWPAECWHTDGSHPGPAGHQLIADGFHEILTRNQ